MSSYFRRVPDFSYISRLVNRRSATDYITVKNLFLRARLREDIFSNLSFFQKYIITGDERPDNIAYNFYGDENLDWVVLLSNNILNIQDEWPKTQNQLDKYLLRKYETYDNLYNGIHHYVTTEYKARNGNKIVKSGLHVDEEFYNAPRYVVEPNDNPFLPKAVPGQNAVATANITSTKISSVDINYVGTGYSALPLVKFSDPDPVITAAGYSELLIIFGQGVQREVGIVSITNPGSGYLAAPTIIFDDPPPTIAPQIESTIGAGGTVTGVTIIDGGDGYTFIPNVTFTTPNNIIGNAALLNQSAFSLGSGLEGMYVTPDGSRLYTAHGDNGYTSGAVEQYDLSTPWDVTTASFVQKITLDFGGLSWDYLTGVEFKPGGSIMYVSGNSIPGGYSAAAYALSTPYDISTASYINRVSVPAPSGIRLQDNGKFLFVLDAINPDSIKRYPLSTAWDLSTKAADYTDFVNLTGLVPSESYFLGFTFSDDGTQLYAAGNDTDTLFVFDLTNPWIVSSATLVTSLNISAQDSAITDVYVNDTKTRLFAAGAQNSKIFEYNIDLTAKGYAVINDEQLVQVVITDPGGGYNSAPEVTIEPPIPHRRATGYATIDEDGFVDNLVLVDGGYNYREAPKITFSSPPTPITAEGYARVNNGGVTDIIVTNSGAGYVSAPSIYIDPPGNVYEPTYGEIYRSGGVIWTYNGYNWQRKVTKGIEYYDEILGIIVEIQGRDCSRPVTNYEYELNIENSKREIFLLKPKYLNVLFDDIEKIMTYEKGTEQYLSSTLKRGDNPRLYE